MVVFAGDPILAADHNGLIERQATTTLASDSATWDDTPEVVVASVSVPVIAGKKYAVWFRGKISADVAGDTANMRIRETNVSGGQVMLQQVSMPTNSTNGFPLNIYGEWVATSTTTQTFVLTGQRSSGTGTAHRIRASGSAPGYFAVDVIPE